MGAHPSLCNYVFVDSPCLAKRENLARYNSYHDLILNQKDPKEFFRSWFSPFVTEKAGRMERDFIIGEAVRRDPKWMAEVMGGLAAAQYRTIGTTSTIFIMEGAQYYGAGNDESWSWQMLYPKAANWLYPGGGHFYFLEDPEPFNLALSDFLKDVTRRPQRPTDRANCKLAKVIGRKPKAKME